jgi:hypothetical protein
MRRGILITCVAVLVLAASASGETRPPFARAYVGTATGTLRVAGGRVDTWTVRGLTFRLQNARFARGRWGGTYLITGGRVTFTTTATGDCNAKKSGSFSLGHLSWDAASLSFLQNLREPGYAYEARVSKEHPVTVTQTCADGASRQDLVSPAGGLWLLSGIGARLVPGKRVAGRHTESDPGRGTRTWTWQLSPR